MYNEIEELEQKLKRGPASDTRKDGLNPMFDLPKAASTWDDPTQVKLAMPAAKGAGDSVVGQVDPDYSGYDDLMKRLDGMKPKDSSLADLISMGVSTGIGAMTGQLGAASKVAGQYGLERAAKHEKREESIEDMILKLRADRAAKMAAGKKGVKVKGAGGGNADDPTKNRYLGPDGYLHTPTRKREDGNWAMLDTDPIYDKPSAQIKSVDTPDGGQVNILFDRNRGTSVGSKNAAATFVEDAKGNKVPVNKHTVLQNGGLPEEFNKTQMQLSKSAQKKYDEVSSKFQSDKDLSRYQQAASDLRAATAAIGSDGELTPSFLLATQRFLGMGMDKGRSLTNDEFQKVEGVNTGFIDKLRNLLIGYKEGKVGSDEVRAEYRKLTALLGNNVEQLRNERIGGYNQQLKVGLNSEWRDDLAFPSAGASVNAKTQASDVKKAEKLSSELKSDKPIIHTVKNKDGSTRKVKMTFNPKTKKYEYAGEAQ